MKDGENRHGEKAAGSNGRCGKVLEMLTEHSVEYVDLRFTDPRGKWQHTAQHVSTIDEDAFRDGIMFDGSSIAGWKAINESDMILMPDADTAVMDPFAAKPSLILFCDIIEPSTGQAYSRDPRSTAKKAEAYVKSRGIGDTAFFGPEAEFFIFDSVQIRHRRQLWHLPARQPGRSAGQREGLSGRQHGPPARRSRAATSRSRRSTARATCAPRCCPPWAKWAWWSKSTTTRSAQSQHELGMKFGPLMRMADHLQIYKYCIHNVAHSYGKTATFMPKPIYGDNGSGMHVHQSIWKAGKPLFAGNGYADLSETACITSAASSSTPRR